MKKQQNKHKEYYIDIRVTQKFIPQVYSPTGFFQFKSRVNKLSTEDTKRKNSTTHLYIGQPSSL